MNPKERERLVDSVLDRAFGPQPVEPRPGLEERILANLSAQQQERRRWRQWIWVPALAAAAVLAIVIGMRLMHRETATPVQVRHTVETPKQEVAVKPEIPARPAIEPPARDGRGIRPVAARPVTVAKVEPSMPRMEVFPAPVPLTDQERLLLALVRRQRPEAELLAAQQQADHDKVQKYFETGEATVAQPTPAQSMR